MSALLELAERCEAATGPDREIDRAIARSQGWHREVPPFTASLDAAVTLIPSGDRRWELTTQASASDPRFGPYQARICIDEVASDPDESGPQGIANGATPALALCAAALRARAATTPASLDKEED